MESYNTDKIVKVKIDGFHLYGLLIYKTERKIFGITLRKEGIYARFGMYGDGIVELPDCCGITKNKEIILKPSVTMYFESNIQKTCYFADYEKAVEFFNYITWNNKFKNLK